MGKQQPQAPDPAQTAAAQGQWNSFTAQQQQAMNMVNQSTPWGSLAYTQTGTTTMTDPSGKQISVPQFTANTTLSPSQQAIFDKTQSAQGNLADLANNQSGMLKDYLSKPFEFNNQDAADWAYDLASSRIMPQQKQDTEALQRQLLQRGLRPGTEQYDAEMRRLTNSQSDQLNQLALNGRSQAFSEAAYTRASPINEVTSLLSGSQVTQPGSTFTNTPQTQVGGVDYSGLVNSNYQAQLAQNNAALGGMFGLGGSLGGGLLSAAGKAGSFGALFSDERLKESITRVGTLDNGLPIYAYRYVWGGPIQIGLMASDVEKVNASAVSIHESGYKMVDYGLATGALQ